MPTVKKFIVKDKNNPDIVKIMDVVSKVDTTLTQENIPAPAKLVGEKFVELDNKISNVETSSKNVFNANTHYDFPSIGSIDVIYKAYQERKTYQWNAEKLVYEPLDEINLIDGGNANGTN